MGLVNLSWRKPYWIQFFLLLFKSILHANFTLPKSVGATRHGHLDDWKNGRRVINFQTLFKTFSSQRKPRPSLFDGVWVFRLDGLLFVV